MSIPEKQSYGRKPDAAILISHNADPEWVTALAGIGMPSHMQSFSSKWLITATILIAIALATPPARLWESLGRTHGNSEGIC
jgi:hypothetical protein